MNKRWIAAACAAVSVFAVASFTSCSDGEDGLSANEIAVANGFTGRESEWLESLKADSLDINEIYAAAQENGYTGTFLEFLQEYLSGDVSVTEDDFEASCMRSVVSIICEFTETTYSYGGGGWFGGGGSTTSSTVYSLASGVIYSLDQAAGDAYIITNYHVVYDVDSDADDHISEDIQVYLYGQEYAGSSSSDLVPDYGISATFVGGSMQNDIAVLKVEGSELLQSGAATAAVFADSNEICVGDTVYAIGNPSGAGISVTKGIISVDSEYITMTSIDETTTVTMREIRIDASVNSGNSGGGLFNADGEIVGIVNAKNAESDVEGIGYALPSTLAKNVAENIIDNCDGSDNTGANRATLGIGIVTTASKSVYNANTGKIAIVEEVTVTSVESDSAAYGKIEVGDVLCTITVNGTTLDVTRRFVITDEMYNVRKGDTVTLTVERDGSVVEVEIVFDSDDYFTTIA